MTIDSEFCEKYLTVAAEAQGWKVVHCGELAVVADGYDSTLAIMVIAMRMVARLTCCGSFKESKDHIGNLFQRYHIFLPG